MPHISIFLALAGYLLALSNAITPPVYSRCKSKDFGHEGTVCVCTEQFCDSFSSGEPLSAQEYAVYTSTKAGDRFKLKTASFNKTLGVKSDETTVKLAVNNSVKFQKILGFGGAFTGQYIPFHVFFLNFSQGPVSEYPSTLLEGRLKISKLAKYRSDIALQRHEILQGAQTCPPPPPPTVPHHTNVCKISRLNLQVFSTFHSYSWQRY